MNIELPIPPTIELILAILALIGGFALLLIALGLLSLLLPAIITAGLTWLLTRSLILSGLVFAAVILWTFSKRRKRYVRSRIAVKRNPA